LRQVAFGNFLYPHNVISLYHFSERRVWRMPFFNLDATTQLYYEDQGQGLPVLFIHGLWCSSRAFKMQLSHFSQRYRAIALDLRGHGRSSHVHVGHTVANYARDVRAFMKDLEVRDAVLVGHSMGALVIWDYIKQFGVENIKATVVIDQPPSDFKWPDWPSGVFDFLTLCQMMAIIQTHRASMVKEAIPLQFKDMPGEENFNMIFEDMTRIPESIACVIFFNEAVQDYREMLHSVAVPTLLCFSGDEKFIPAGGREHLQKNLPNARLVIFENSGHFLILEEPDRFNEAVDKFIQSLD
jgi:non-heme chloroperoxidase